MQGGEPPALEVFDDTTASSLNIKEFAVGEDRRLRMNGRAVFSFSATQVPKALTEVLARNELTWPDVDRIILHQGSRFIVETIGSRIGDASPGGREPRPGRAGAPANRSAFVAASATCIRGPARTQRMNQHAPFRARLSSRHGGCKGVVEECRFLQRHGNAARHAAEGCHLELVDPFGRVILPYPRSAFFAETRKVVRIV